MSFLFFLNFMVLITEKIHVKLIHSFQFHSFNSKIDFFQPTRLQNIRHGPQTEMFGAPAIGHTAHIPSVMHLCKWDSIREHNSTWFREDCEQTPSILSSCRVGSHMQCSWVYM